VRWRSPVGPVEMAVAYGVEPRKFRLHFTAGFVF
jgi:translocation and assembly module TamA